MDIEGLRGVAVLLVVLYHSGVTFLPGGYVGVDTFFVISGFLITLHLIDPSKRLSLRQFYARRIRRLLPSALLVLLVTLIAARIWGPILQVTSVAQDALATAALVVNYRFAASGLDYLQQGANPSPLLHFWSLAVEEQFYFVWPLVILVVLGMTKLRPGRARTTAFAVVAVVVVAASLIASITMTGPNPSISYFSIQTRAWELGVGAIIAIAAPLCARIPAAISVVLGWAGLALVLGSAVLLTDASPFPGYLAIAPVAGSGLIIVGGFIGSRGSVGSLLGTRILRFLGSVSYTWYLWHWPIIVIAPYLFHTSFNVGDKLAMSFLALWFAILTSLWIERPLLRTPLSSLPWFRIAAVGAVVTFVIAGSMVMFPPHVYVPAAAAAPSSLSNSGNVSPAVELAEKDKPAYPAECIADFLVVEQPPCFIETDGTDRGVATAGRVVLLGDSHAGHWYPVTRSVADLSGTDVEVLNKVGCPLADLTVINATLKREYTECNQWRDGMLDRLESEPKPSIIFISALNKYQGNDGLLVSAWKVTMKRLDALGVPIVYLVDTPHPLTDVPSCVAVHLNDWSACAFDRKLSVVADGLSAMIANGEYKNVHLVDENPYLCPGDGPTCPAVLDGILLYRDGSHMTNTAAASLTSRVEAELVSQKVIG
jgi:peptidoglycan/LPS O-acetylase OafA/YrhL